MVGVNEKTVRRWMQAGKLPYTRQGRENVVLVEDVRRLASENGAGPHARAEYRRLFGRLYWRRSK
jgi:predicted site-specific integrase-resolvase